MTTGGSHMKLRAPRSFLLLATAAALGLPLLAVAPTSAGAATGCSAPTSLWVTIATPTRVIYPQRVTVNGYAYQTDHSPACGAAVSVHAVSGKGAGSVQYASKVGPTGRF